MLIRTANLQRSGYTLLEILLASAIALILLAALYITMDVTLVRMDVSRDVVNANDFSRAVFNKMSTDLSASLGVLPPNSGGANIDLVESTGSTSGTSSSSTSNTGSSSSGSSASSGSSSGSTSSSSTSSGSSSSGSSSSTATPTTDEMTTTAANLNFQAGVFGNDKSLTIFSSRVPPALSDAEAAANLEAQLPGDLVRVTYYLGSNGGLCRQVRPWVTADGVGNTPEPDYSTEAVDLIAPEVVDASFEYFDGGVWLGEWDGSQTGLDGMTLIGPPRAIRVTLVLEVTSGGNQVTQKTVQKVFVVRAAAGTYTPPTTIDDSTTTTTTTTTTTSGGSMP